jgi:hypothetical protein
VRYPIVLAVTLFGLLSFVMSIIGLQLGGKLGKATGEHGEVVGAIMLLGLSGVMAAGWLLPRREREVTALPPHPRPQPAQPAAAEVERVPCAAARAGAPGSERAQQSITPPSQLAIVTLLKSAY